ncbi:MAG: tRNA (adenosine(37)-N6)-dimethylallyltransferase MiaA [Bacteroidetes bacterium]|nr:MAG: tRNA (adenosine(37)-N6)-dimethylallyltransferase MiaA [Bacteroidota bacterium]
MPDLKEHILICICGPTAVGKTALSLALARYFDTEIISSDSRQVFRGMDIGTAKPGPAERGSIPHHLIDILDPDQTYNAGQFVRDAEVLLHQIFTRKKVCIMVGGSTLYTDAFWYGLNEMPEVAPELRATLKREWEVLGPEPLLMELQEADPETFARIDRQNPSRVLRALELIRTSGRPASELRTGRKAIERSYRIVKIALHDHRENLYARINHRVDEMMDAGLAGEVRSLLAKGYSPDSQALQTIGYAEMILCLKGEMSIDEAITAIRQHSRNYAKRQLTWLRRYQDMVWIQAGAVEQMAAAVLKEIP